MPHYEHTEVGYNYRLSNILAALGRAQLTRLDDMLKRRREWRERYRALFAPMSGVEILGGAADAEDNCWLTAIVVDGKTAGWTAAELSDAPASRWSRDPAGLEAHAPAAGVRGLEQHPGWLR